MHLKSQSADLVSRLMSGLVDLVSRIPAPIQIKLLGAFLTIAAPHHGGASWSPGLERRPSTRRGTQRAAAQCLAKRAIELAARQPGFAAHVIS
jgi:hypothetical protein